MANVQLVLNSRDRVSGQYNAANYSAIGQNLVQGEIKEVLLSEVNFPYDIPNIQEGYNSFTIANATAGAIDIVVGAGFYTGAELAEEINTVILAEGADLDPALVIGQLPSVTYSESSNTFAIKAPTTTTGDYTLWFITSPYVHPELNVKPSYLGKDILSIMGFSQDQYTLGNWEVDSDPDNPQANLALFSGSAPLVFTQYIDICSPQLCKFQYFSDGSTTNLARRTNVICRLYISNNVSVNEQEGARPFIVNRQFYNPRVMRWTTDNAVGTIDINLYDDCGVPLTTTWIPRHYQITFDVVENNKDEGLRY